MRSIAPPPLPCRAPWWAATGHLQTILGNYLSESAAQPDAAIAVNPPVDLGACSDTIHRGLSRLYELRFIKRCRKAIHQRVKDDLIANIYPTGPLMSLREFDDAYTTKAGGFLDADDYYAKCSARHHLSKITVPTVILMAVEHYAKELLEA